VGNHGMIGIGLIVAAGPALALLLAGALVAWLMLRSAH
jgi:hypothetical protein